ncbi:MAG: hypothetical protein COU81_03450 [Candidatus Portnoybacteria bacterium CG10_big_fil_rev_8_21_14_0_10_36_7]|uniref:Ancillary SecYEG translocon subunit/Cell division coordinator CpoB TPR domain-containing protein n=1 Tax=Candidatus Portnoybacteria bacterium CG10_big_fil_rev_8_21_14_0_10_36_7 TaxID=1974812 RepID=A0A2M8KDD1_9BACT|nr:MAG: hypothetical protein COU81_03450 [Candidatus Portnoybacteria bacterium CG10_big_fil_rev_8_21_14_0_10_36_7]
MNNRNYIVLSLVLVLGIIGGISFYNNYQATKEQEAFEVLLNNHLQGQQVRETIDKAENDLRDGNEDNDFTAYAIIGAQRNIVGDLTGAEKYYLKALELRPSDNLVLWNLASVYINEKKFNDVEKVYGKLINLDPYTVRYSIALADLYRYQLNDQAKMEDTILRGLANNEDHNDLLAYLAVYFKDNGDNTKAIEYYEKLVSAHPENVAAKKDLDELQK